MHQIAPSFRRTWPYRKPKIAFKIFTKVFIEPTEINSHINEKGLRRKCEYLPAKHRTNV